MSYFVKWIVAGHDEVIEQPTAYAELSDAIDFACPVLDRSPIEIWVENERGEPVAFDFRIRQHCQSKRRM